MEKMWRAELETGRHLLRYSDAGIPIPQGDLVLFREALPSRMLYAEFVSKATRCRSHIAGYLQLAGCTADVSWFPFFMALFRPGVIAMIGNLHASF